MVLQPLEPDRLGEDFLALMLPNDSQSETLPGPFGDTAAPAILTRVLANRSQPQLVRTVAVLVESSVHWEHVGRQYLLPALRADPQLALAAHGNTMARICSLPNMDASLLGQIDALLDDEVGPGGHLKLDVGAAAVLVTLDGLASEPSESDCETLWKLCRRLRRAGRLAEALDATRRHANVLVMTGQDDSLAVSRIGLILAEMGLGAEALPVAQIGGPASYNWSDSGRQTKETRRRFSQPRLRLSLGGRLLKRHKRHTTIYRTLSHRT